MKFASWYNVIMLMQSKQLAGLRILSLHTGAQIGQLSQPIINPYRFEVVGFYCEGPAQKRQNEATALLIQDIRQISASGAVINSADEITPLSELVRLQEVTKINFKLIGKPVRTESKQRVGKVDDYVVNTQSFIIQKIYVRQPFLKSFALHSLTVDRQQIVEIRDRFITVSDATIAKPAVVPATST